jgi:E3 SUMO-protein ligase PIAS1
VGLSTNEHSQKFYLGVFLCKSHSVPSLVGKIEQQARISQTSVIQECMRHSRNSLTLKYGTLMGDRSVSKQAQDPDIQATSQNFSLKCPLTYMRLDLPVRSISCKHNQCFDATSYLQLQEQGPVWICPICNQPAPFRNLAVDEYVPFRCNMAHKLRWCLGT